MLPIHKADKLAVQLKQKLQLFSVNRLAIETGFVKRKPRKIWPINFLLGFFIMTLTGSNSLSSFATTIGLIGGVRISKQAVDKRIKEPLIHFLQSVLALSLLHNMPAGSKSLYKNLATKFNRILVEDSTNIQLDSKLAEEFPGSKNATGKKYAVLKIQAVFDLLCERFHHFSISAFTRNDQKASKDILTLIKAGDLIIRDLGYFVLSALKEITLRNANFLCRMKQGITLYETDGNTTLNLLGKLRKYERLDIDIVIGAKEKLSVRLVALPVPENVAEERRRKAKRNRDRRCNPSKIHLALLGWNILITSVDRELLDGEQLAVLYGCRWRIEIIFKSWKSHFSLTNVPKASIVRVKSYIYSMLIFITLFQTWIFVRMYRKLCDRNNEQLSLLKVSRFFKEQIWAIVLYLYNQGYLEDQILYHCLYEPRNNKVNYFQQIAKLG
jgi:hypothetical protein